MPETCETCKYYEESWDGKHCMACNGENSKYEPIKSIADNSSL